MSEPAAKRARVDDNTPQQRSPATPDRYDFLRDLPSPERSAAINACQKLTDQQLEGKMLRAASALSPLRGSCQAAIAHMAEPLAPRAGRISCARSRHNKYQ